MKYWKKTYLYLCTALSFVFCFVACQATPATDMTQVVTQTVHATIIPEIKQTTTLQVTMVPEVERIATELPSPIPSPVPKTPTPTAALTPLPKPTLAPTKTTLGGWLVFESAREDTNKDGVINQLDNIHVFSLNLDTNTLTQLTFGDHRNLHPTWSPDGEKIAFVSNQNGNFDLYVMNADGSEPLQLTETPENETTPVWSVDGTRLIYVRAQTVEDGLEERHLYIVTIDSNESRRLINLPGNSFDPALSPDGRFLTFTQVEPFTFEGQIRTGTVIYLHDMQSGQSFRVTSTIFETGKGQFQDSKWLPRTGWYLSMAQVPGDSNPSGLKVFALIWDETTPFLQQVLEFDEGPGPYVWGSNGEWLMSANHRTIIMEEGILIPTTDLFTIPISFSDPPNVVPLDPAMQSSGQSHSGEGSWLTNDIFYEGNLDWKP